MRPGYRAPAANTEGERLRDQQSLLRCLSGLPCPPRQGSKRSLLFLPFKGLDPGKRWLFLQMPFGVFLSSAVGLSSARRGAHAGTQPEIPRAFGCVSFQVPEFLKHQNSGFLFSFLCCVFNSIPPSIWARSVRADIAGSLCLLGIRLWAGLPSCPCRLQLFLRRVCSLQTAPLLRPNPR